MYKIKAFLIGFVKLLDNTKDGWYVKQFENQLPKRIDEEFIKEWYIIQPPFNSVNLDGLREVMKYAEADYTQIVYDPLLEKNIERPIAIGKMYFSKLGHIADMKMSARSVGITSPKTMQPLSGKRNKGGQKMGEMETMCLIGYDMIAVANECRTVKSDSIEKKDVVTREIVYGETLKLGTEVLDIKPETNHLLDSFIASLTIDIGELKL
jgi:DNA-directed RNA polymerase subunit beta